MDFVSRLSNEAQTLAYLGLAAAVKVGISHFTNNYSLCQQYGINKWHFGLAFKGDIKHESIQQTCLNVKALHWVSTRLRQKVFVYDFDVLFPRLRGLS